MVVYGLRCEKVIRAATLDDVFQLESLYSKSIYHGLPEFVKWALKVVPGRIFVAEERQEISAAIYVDVSPAGYGHLWSSYLAFKETTSVGNLIDHLMSLKEEKELRNLYVFCPKEFVDVRVLLISRGFIPECIRKIGGIDYIIESYDGTFNPSFRACSSKRALPVSLRKGKRDDLKALAKVLHNSLPIDFPHISRRCSYCQKMVNRNAK